MENSGEVWRTLVRPWRAAWLQFSVHSRNSASSGSVFVHHFCKDCVDCPYFNCGKSWFKIVGSTSNDHVISYGRCGNVECLTAFKLYTSFKTSRSGEPNLLKTSSWYECKIPVPRRQTVDLFYIIVTISRRSSYPGSKVLMEVVTSS